MAVTYGFYNALNHDRLYDAIQMSSIFDGIIRDGIFSTIGDTMIVTAPEDGMYVNVGSGRAWFNHTWTLNDTAYPIEAEQAEVVLDRIDAVILEVNSSAEVRANSIKFLKGTPSSNPVKPTLTHNAEVNQYALAYVRIRAGQTTIFQSDIENAVGTDETPFITGVLQQVSIETLLKQWEAEFNTYFTNFQNTSTTEFNNWLATKVSEYTAWFAQMQTDMDSNFDEFDAWFQRMKDQLSSDAAGHLQAQIDALSEAAKKGSVVTITTTDPTLFGKNVTISKTGFDPVTSSFNSAGVAYFETVPMVGDVSIEATNGTLTAHGSINIPYFGRYSTTLEFWEAILDISTDIESLYNRQITVTKNSSTVGTTTFDSTGHATFSVHSVGTYHVSATDNLSKTYEADVDVTEETTYIVEFIDAIDGATVEPTDDITTWLKCANIEDPSITTLDDVLANRSLFETLIANSNACNYMARSTTWALAEGLVPTMTSNTEPSGECIASADSANAYKAFNNNASDFWGNNVTSSASIGYMFSNKVSVKCIEMTNRSDSGITSPKNLIVQGSDDGTNWNDIVNYTNSNTVNGNKWKINVNANTSYKYWRLNITSLNSQYLNIAEIQFYSELDITTSQDAMSLIGKYDYCSNALLSNATWAEAICKSEYFEEILNVSVPKMTSNTAPSGEVITDTYPVTTNQYPWYAFADTASLAYQSYFDSKYIGYKFTEKVNVKYLYFRSQYGDGGSGEEFKWDSFKLQGSNDGTTWTDIQSFTNTQSVKDFYAVVNNTNSYIYYRLSNFAYGGGYDIIRIQFYGRASAQTNIIHSAANDTIYMMKDGSEVVLTTTDSNGVGTLDFTQFDDGVTYTLYSSVAKDPNNLSNDYSKNIRITKSKYGCTTEAYLIPDGAIYWYGNICNWLTGGLDKSLWINGNTNSYTLNTHDYKYLSNNDTTYDPVYYYKNNITCRGYNAIKTIAKDGGFNRAKVGVFDSKNTHTMSKMSNNTIGTSYALYSTDVSNYQSSYPNLGTFGNSVDLNIQALWLE